MIKFIDGDMLTVKRGVLIHQVNTLGKAGSGIVVGIKNTFNNWYINYKSLCDQYKENPNNLLGTTQFYHTGLGDLHVANLFSQFSIKPFSRNTDLDALKQALLHVEAELNGKNLPAYLPYGLASVRGGMDWDAEVYPIIESVFKDSSVDLYIVNYQEGLKIG